MAGVTEVQCLHLLCKHTGSRNPKSRRTNETITISKEQAHQHLNAEISKLSGLSGHELMAQFQDQAKHRSDCGSFQRGGDLGMFGRGQMQKPFEDASFGLNVGEMSGIVDTPSGSHIILRVR